MVEPGHNAWIIESGHIISEVTILSESGGFFLIMLKSGGAIRVRRSRLYATREEAEAVAKPLPVKHEESKSQDDQPRRRNPWDYS